MPQIQTLVKRLKPNFGTAVQLEACGQLCEQLFQKENPPLGAVVANRNLLRGLRPTQFSTKFSTMCMATFRYLKNTLAVVLNLI